MTIYVSSADPRLSAKLESYRDHQLNDYLNDYFDDYSEGEKEEEEDEEDIEDCQCHIALANFIRFCLGGKMNIKELLAQGYHTNRNSYKVIDVELLSDMEKILIKAIKKLPRYYYSNCQGLVRDKKIGGFILIDDILKEEV